MESGWVAMDIERPLMTALTKAQLCAIRAWAREHDATKVRVITSGPGGGWVIFETLRASYNRRVTRRGKIGF